MAGSRHPLAAWAVGLIAGFAVAVKTLSGSLLLNWDQVVGDVIPIPPGQYGAGLELPRRVPFYTLLAPFSQLVPGPTVVGVFLIVAVAVATVGTVRLVGSTPLGLVLGLAYGLSPFLLTRAAVGHLPLVAATAMLPWALRHLGSPSRSVWPHALGWSAAFAMTGSSGVVIGLVPITIALALDTVPPVTKVFRFLAVAVAQSIWVGPGLVAVGRHVPLPETEVGAFATQASGVAEGLRLVVGGGFFIGSEDVAKMTQASLVLAAVLLGLTVWAALSGDVQRTEAAGLVLLSGIVGGVLVLAPVTPGLDAAWNWLVGLGPLAILREPQKFWPLMSLAVLLLAAQVGSRFRLGIAAATLTLIIVSAWPGLWGADGRLNAYEPPQAWATVTDELRADPGRTVVLPWRRYDRLDISQGRNVLQPGPWLLPGEILTSGDPGLGSEGNERGEPKERELAAIDAIVRGGQPVGPMLQGLGVDWLVVSGSPDADFYRRIGREPEATAVVEEGNILLYRVSEGVDYQPPDNDANSATTVSASVALLSAFPTLIALITGFGWTDPRRKIRS